MKKLMLLFGSLFLLASCTKEETMNESLQPDKSAEAPPIYGMAMLKNVPQTRGVANKMKIWSNVMAQEDLSVEFLNGPTQYHDFVKEVAQEWEKVANVKFHFHKDTTQEAMIRIGFDFVPGMQSSWSYTGTDHTYLLEYQNEPTMHFARWRRASDACKRSDVLRAFGQVLGLELEFRHPDFYPGWKTNEDGTIDEAYIREYWEYELADFISWTELKTMVLDPINVSARFIAKTNSYDQNSVMCWPFYDELMAKNIRPITYDTDYNTELSASDVSFIQKIYGEPTGDIFLPSEFFPLIEFNYTGTKAKVEVSSTKNLGVKWDADEKVVERFDHLENDSIVQTNILMEHTYPNTNKRKIVIGEILEPGQEMPTISTALKHLNLYAEGADSIIIKPFNQALQTVWIRGGSNFIEQDIDLMANEYIKNLFLIRTLGSTVNVDNCKKLELLSTTPTIYMPADLQPQLSSLPNIGEINPGPGFWPDKPFYDYSLGNSTGDGVNIQNCSELTTISLDNTQIKNITFAGRDKLDYVYLSSLPNYIVGGGDPKGQYLLNAVKTLPLRDNGSPGIIIIRGVKYEIKFIPPPGLGKMECVYCDVSIKQTVYDQIQMICSSKNWNIVWDSGVTLEP